MSQVLLLFILFPTVCVVSFSITTRLPRSTTRVFSLKTDSRTRHDKSSNLDNRAEKFIRIPSNLRTHVKPHDSKNDKRIQVIDTNMYEMELIEMWEKDISLQRGFDWEIEKLRRYFAGLRMLPDGTWVRKPSLFAFLVSNAKKTSIIKIDLCST